MVDTIKKNISLIFILLLTVICAVVNETGLRFELTTLSMLTWVISGMIIFASQKKNVIKGIKYAKTQATPAELFVAISHIAFAMVCVIFILIMTFVFPNGFITWDAAIETTGSLAWRLFSYSIHVLLFGIGLLLIFPFIGGILLIPFTIIGRSLFKDDYSYVRFPNIWMDYCSFPIALFAFVTQLTGAADLYYIIEYYVM